jgi:hypothetical protein
LSPALAAASRDPGEKYVTAWIVSIRTHNARAHPGAPAVTGRLRDHGSSTLGESSRRSASRRGPDHVAFGYGR